VSIGKVILVVLATLVIFSTGLLTGVVLIKQINPPPAPAPPPAAEGPRWQQFLHRIESELDLSPEQHQRIVALLHESQEWAKGLAGAEFRKVREQIVAELTPAQKEKFDRLLKERQRRMRELMSQEGRDGSRRASSNAPPPAAAPAQ